MKLRSVRKHDLSDEDVLKLSLESFKKLDDEEKKKYLDSLEYQRRKIIFLVNERKILRKLNGLLIIILLFVVSTIFTSWILISLMFSRGGFL